MDDVKRYDLIDSAYGPFMGAVPKGGDWVSFEDYAALRARLEAVEKDQLEMVKRYDAMTRRVEQSEARAERAEAALATARRDALEQAAREIDCGGCYGKPCLRPGECMQDLANDIRALANEAET